MNRPDQLALHPQNIGQYPIRPREAVQAFRRLVADKEDTVQVFRFIRALAGNSLAKGYLRLLTDPEGGREAYRGEELADCFQDPAWLDQFANGTVGARYREFIAMRNLSAYGLADESRKLGEADIDAAHPIAWFARRGRDVHDSWHVLTGYGTDALGEASLLAFTYAQTQNRGLGLLALAAALELQRSSRGVPYWKSVLEGWRHGSAAKWLMPLNYAALFSEPLESARERLAIKRPTIYESIPFAQRNGYNAQTPEHFDSFDGWPSEA